MEFVKATRQQAKLRMALIGPAGSGKSYSALGIAGGLGGKIAAIDTERGSLSKYARTFNFDVLELTSFSPQNYIEAIHAAEKAGYGVLIIDSLSHAWAGKDGVLEFVDKRKAQNRGNDFAVWRDATPLQNALVDAILGASLHIIAAMRSKMEYVIEKDANGKSVPRKIGLQPVQRDQIEYEFDLVGDLDQDHTLVVTKSRIEPLADAVVKRPGAEVGKQLADWLNEGAAELPVKKTASRKVKPEDSVIAPASSGSLKDVPSTLDDVPLPNKPDPWMRKANALLAEKGLKMSEIPWLVAKGGPTPLANLFLWARAMEPITKLAVDDGRFAEDYLLEQFAVLIENIPAKGIPS